MAYGRFRQEPAEFPRTVTTFERELENRLTAIRDQGLYRQLRRVDSSQGPRIEIAGKTLRNFSSNDYLGLANHPALKNAAAKAVETFGAGSGASRLICGSIAPHHALEESLAAFKGTPAALSFSSGYTTAIGAICALLSKEDIIVLDKLVHACIVDAARLCKAQIRVFGHNDLNDLQEVLQWADQKRRNKPVTLNGPVKILIVTESVFSMDGDAAPLKEIVVLKEKYGAWLMVDEAHATGLYGANRRGLVEELGVSEMIEIQMGTLGKALGASGGYICGSRRLIDFLVNRARSFIFSTAPVPAAAAAAAAGINLVDSYEGQKLNEQLWSRVGGLHSELCNPEPAVRTAIVPIILGDEGKAVKASARLREQGIFVPAIRYPTVARGSARLRVTLTAAHSDADVAELTRALTNLDFSAQTVD